MPLPSPIRSLFRARGLAAVVVGTLAVGIGAVTTTFALVDGALLRQPPFPQAVRLVMLYTTRTQRGGQPQRQRWSFARVQLLRQLATSFESLGNYTPAAGLTLTGTDEPEPVQGEVAGPSYFRTLGVRALQGRTFADDEDDAPGAHPVALIGHDLWKRRYAGDPRAVGMTIGVNGTAHTVVGVMPRGFGGLSGHAQLWVPTTMAPVLSYADYLTTNQNFIPVVARLRDGVTLDRARREMELLGGRIDAAIPSARDDSTATYRATAVSLNESRVDRLTRRSVLTLLVAVALLHLLACANVTSLLLGRAATRRREVAVRLAVGCGQGRLLRHFMAEGMVLAGAGGALGMLLARWVSGVLQVPPDVVAPRTLYGTLASFADPSFGARTIAFGVALTIVTALLVAWAPAVSALRVDIVSGLREAARGMAAGGATLRRPSARGVVVAIEAALAMLLLIAGGLVIDSFLRMRGTSLGIDPNNVVTFLLRPNEVRIPPPAAPAFLGRVLDAIGRVPGVVAATVDGCTPVGTSCANTTLFIMGRPMGRREDAPPILRHYVAPDHFKTLGVPVLRGRTFSAADVAGRPKVAIINAAAARRFWPNENPIGQRVWFGGGSTFDRPDSSAEIVGIVGDVAYQPLDERPLQFDFYTPYTQFTYAWRVVMVRTAGDPAAVLPGIRAAVRSVDPDLPLHDVQTMSQRIGGSWSKHRFNALLFATFSIVALLLAATGIYAVVAYAVSHRTREMGVRLALGASPSAVLRLVVREGMALPIIGLAIGLVASLAVTRLLRASLYEVTTTDPVVYASTVAVLFAVSVLACLLPARRATRIDPLEALRAE
jgi:putative ABC transport system permease protein